MALSLGTAVVVIDGSIATVALPTIAKALAVGDSDVVMVVTIYQLIVVMTLLPFSALGEWIGLRRLYRMGMLCFLGATLFCFFAKTLTLLLIVRSLQALAAAAILSVATGLLRLTYPEQQLGRALGLNATVIGIAGAIAPPLGGAMIAIAPWPWVFTAVIPVAAASLWWSRHLPAPEPQTHRFDFGAALLSAAMFGFIIASIEGLVQGQRPAPWVILGLAGILIGVLFVRSQLRVEVAILPVDLLRNPVLAMSVAGAFTAFLSAQAVILALPFRLEHGFGFSPAQIGAAIAPWPITSILIAPLASFLADRYHPAYLGAAGMAIATAGLLGIAWLPAEPTLVDLAWRMMLAGAGFGLFLLPNARLLISSAPPSRTAAVGGLIATTRLTGQILGATLIAGFLALELGNTMLPTFASVGFAILAGLCSVGRVPRQMSQSHALS